MKLHCLRVLTGLALAASVIASAGAADVTGTWKFSVDLDNGEHGDPVFVIKQLNDQLTGTDQGPFGKQKVTGSVQGETVRLEVAASGGGRTLKLSYTGRRSRHEHYRLPNTTATGKPGTEVLPVGSVFVAGSGCSPPRSSSHPAMTTRL